MLFLDSHLIAITIGITAVLSTSTWGVGIDPGEIDWADAENLALNKPVNIPEE